MNPDKTAIEKLYYVKKDQEQAVFWLDAFIEAVNADHDDLILVPRDHGCLMRDEIERLRRVERAALSEAEGERERLQTQIDDIADELGCTEKTSHRHSHGRCIFAAIENLRTEGERWISVGDARKPRLDDGEDSISEEVLVHVPTMSPKVRLGCYLHLSKKFRPSGSIGFEKDVTHWQPLPAPPKEKP